MVWNYGNDSSDSEEERHDKFRSERSAAVNTKKKCDILTSLKGPHRPQDRFRDGERYSSERHRRSPISSKSHLSTIKDGPYDRNRSGHGSDRSGKSSHRDSRSKHSSERRRSHDSVKPKSDSHDSVKPKSDSHDSVKPKSESHSSSRALSKPEEKKKEPYESRRLLNGDSQESHKRSIDSDRFKGKKHKSETCDVNRKSYSVEELKVTSKVIKNVSKDLVTNKKSELMPYDQDLITLDTYSNSSLSDSDSKPSVEQMFGPVLPPKRDVDRHSGEGKIKKMKKCKRKALSRKLKKEASEERMKSKVNESVDDKKTELYGPAMPLSQHTSEGKEEETSRPAKGTSSREEELEEGEVTEEDEEETYGPALPPGPASTIKTATQQRPEEEEEEEGDDGTAGGFGPALPDAPLTPAQLALNHRAALLKLHMDNKSKEKEVAKREEWMLELPEKHSAGLGLVSRTFKSKESTAVRDSAWTDTPADKARKAALKQYGVEEDIDPKKEHEKELLAMRDKEMEKMAKKANKEKKRESKSLLEIHQEKLKKKKIEDKGKKQERRPFSRETDLQVNVLTDAQKKAIYKKASNLDSRFSSGQTKYL